MGGKRQDKRRQVLRAEMDALLDRIAHMIHTTDRLDLGPDEFRRRLVVAERLLIAADYTLRSSE